MRFKFNVKRFIKDIKRAWRYAKLGWQQTAYDHSDIYRAIDIAMEDLEPTIRRGHGTNSIRIAKKMRIVREYIRRILNAEDEYQHLHDALDAKYGAAEHYFEKLPNGCYTMKDKNLKREGKTFKKEYLNTIKKDEALQQRDKTEMFRLLHKYIDRMWD